MAANSTNRENRRRVARMEARRAFAAARARRRKRDNLFAGTAALVVLALAVALQIAWFSSNPTAEELALLKEEAGVDREVPDPSVAAGKVFTGGLSLGQGEVGVELDGNVAPQAAAVFKSLADDGWFNGKSCHRLTTLPEMGILQCGSPNGDGAADQDFLWGPVENTPADGFYPAGSIAVARGDSVTSHGTQFFLVYKDSTITQASGGYTIMGKVTSGLDVLESIASQGVASGENDGTPNDPVTINSFTLN